MAGKRKAPLWRQVFLRALRRTGNVRVAAAEAGVDPGTAYDHRAKDAGFRGAWDAAKAAFKAGAAKKHAAGEEFGAGSFPGRSPGARRAPAPELVLRRSKAGDRLVRAAPGRWSSRVEESFLDALGETGCVRLAAASAGLSTNAFYARRDKYPEFAARWDERVARFQAQLPGLINAAAVEAVSPQPEGAKRRGRARLPKLSGDAAVRVYAINENAKARGRGPARNLLRKPELSREELEDTFVKLVGLMKRRRERERQAAGWTEVDGIWLPPGWTVTRPHPGDGDGSGASPA